MMFSTKSRAGILLTAVVLATILLVAACSSADVSPTATPQAPEAAATWDVWTQVLNQVPYPYTTPLPPENPSVIDGLYAKFDPREGTRPFCRRCMSYPAEGGVWLLQIDGGVYRIFSKRSLNGWYSVGSVAVSEDRLWLFNDPHCMENVGLYTWVQKDGELGLEAIEDDCADGFRAITFTNYPWVLDSTETGG